MCVKEKETTTCVVSGWIVILRFLKNIGETYDKET
jgi:hypothetical protein